MAIEAYCHVALACECRGYWSSGIIATEQTFFLLISRDIDFFRRFASTIRKILSGIVLLNLLLSRVS